MATLVYVELTMQQYCEVQFSSTKLSCHISTHPDGFHNMIHARLAWTFLSEISLCKDNSATICLFQTNGLRLCLIFETKRD